MRESQIEELLEAYGLERILEDNDMTLSKVLDLVEQLGYLNLEMYLDDE